MEDDQINAGSSLLEAQFMNYQQECQLEPPDIYLDNHIMDVKFSPCANVIALGQVTGHIRVYTYDDKETKEQLTFDFHKESCRALEFSPDGNIIYTGSKDQSLAVLTNGVMAGRIHDAHDAPIYSLLHLEGGHTVASGDDDGCIRIWDLRVANQGKKHSIQMEFKEHEGTVSQMVYNDVTQQIVTASGDGMLGVFDLRKRDLYAMSDNFEEDLTSVTLQKEGRKVLAASSDGIINVFSWDYFGDCNDRIVGHPGAVDTMAKYDEDVVITGCEDGLVRAVSVLPNKIIAILGDPLDTEDEVFHIQKVTISHDRKFVASSTLDDVVKIIDVQNLQSRVKDDSFDVEAYEHSVSDRLKANHGKPDPKEAKENEEDWEDDSDMDSDDDDSDSSEDEGKKKEKKKSKQLNPKNASLGASKKMIDEQKKKDFFDDL